MTLKAILKHQRESGHICFIRQGLFYRGYDASSEVLHRLLGYERKHKFIKSCGCAVSYAGFPAIARPKVVDILTQHAGWIEYYTRGVDFLGVRIKGGAVLTGKRTKAGAANAIWKWSQAAKFRLLTSHELRVFRASINSYWGVMRHYNSYKLRKKQAQAFGSQLRDRTSTPHYCKVKLKDYTTISRGRVAAYEPWWNLFDE